MKKSGFAVKRELELGQSGLFDAAMSAKAVSFWVIKTGMAAAGALWAAKRFRKLFRTEAS